MPAHLRALLVLLAISLVVFTAAKPFAKALGVSEKNFVLRRNSWLTTLSLVFLSSNFWLAMLAVFYVSMIFGRKDSNPVAFFLLQLFCFPLAREAISGFGVFGHLIEVDHLRVMSLSILLPLAYQYWKTQPKVPLKLTDPQVIMCTYFGVIFFLSLPLASFFGVIRGAVFYPLVDAIVLLYVARRELRSTEKLRDFLVTFVVGGVLLSVVAIVELSRTWLLFETLSGALGVNAGYGIYVLRGDATLRAAGSASHPIVLGYVIMVSLLIALGLNNIEKNKGLRIAILILIIGFIAPVSRGPWVGFAVGFALFMLVAKEKSKVFLLTALMISAVALTAAFTEVGSKLVSYLPFIGDAEVETIDYRVSLMDATIQVVRSNPFFGAYDFMLRSEMESLRQGQGIIDLVNTYAGIALSSGLVGLSLFVSIFAMTMWKLWQKTRSRSKATTETNRVIGWVLLSIIIAILATIYTVSPIAFIPPIYWLILGASLAHAERNEE
jgi:O-antigen ligase